MPETQKQWRKRLEAEGYVMERGGKHQVKMTKPRCRPITLPDNHRRAYPAGLEAALRRQLQENARMADKKTTSRATVKEHD